MELEHRGVVNCESGTLLVGDAAAVQAWRGFDQEPAQAEIIQRFLQSGDTALSMDMGQGAGVLWNIEGSGTVDVFDVSANSFLLLRSWLTDDSDFDAALAFVSKQLQHSPTPNNEFTVSSGNVAVLWAVEDGECVRADSNGGFRLDTDLTMSDSSGLILRANDGVYRCTYSETESGRWDAQWCYLLKV